MLILKTPFATDRGSCEVGDGVLVTPEAAERLVAAGHASPALPDSKPAKVHDWMPDASAEAPKAPVDSEPVAGDESEQLEQLEAEQLVEDAGAPEYSAEVDGERVELVDADALKAHGLKPQIVGTLKRLGLHTVEQVAAVEDLVALNGISANGAAAIKEALQKYHAAAN